MHIKRGQTVAELACYAVKESSCKKLLFHQGQRKHGAICVGFPGRSRSRIICHGGDVAPWKPADRCEGAAEINDAVAQRNRGNGPICVWRPGTELPRIDVPCSCAPARTARDTCKVSSE